MKNNTKFKNLNIAHAEIKGDLDLSNKADVTGEFDAYAAAIHGSLTMLRKSSFDSIELRGASIYGDVALAKGTEVEEKLDAQSALVDGSIFIESYVIFNDVYL